MTLREACQILAATHTRPSRDYGVIVQISAPIPRGAEDRYIEAWARVHAFANAPAPSGLSAIPRSDGQ